MRGLLAWMNGHGGQYVTSLELQGSGSVPYLPCQRLKQLEIAYCRGVQLAGQPGVPQACSSSLTRLVLRCFAVGVQAGLVGLSCLVNLQHLESDMDAGYNADPVETFPGMVLSNMVHLMHLKIKQMKVDELQYVSCLSCLHELTLQRVQTFTLTPEISPGFCLPPTLTCLVLESHWDDSTSALEPTLLHSLTNLEVLNVGNAALTGSCGGGGGGAALLAALPQLQKLQHLHLCDISANWPAVSSVSYSALVPSSGLTSYQVQQCVMMPVGVLQHIFTASRVLPNLRSVCANDGQWSRQVTARQWNQAVVANIASCCPALQELRCNLPPHVTSLAPLQQLSGLTYLSVLQPGGTTADCQAMLQACAALTSLHSLTLLFITNDGFSHDSLVPLTALQQLTYLICWESRPGNAGGDDIAIAPIPPMVNLSSKVSAEQ